MAGAVVAISASQVGDWLTVAERIAGSPAGLLLFCMLVLVLLVWLLVRQYQSGQECEERLVRMQDTYDDKIAGLTDAMRTLHTLLVNDDRYGDKIPSFDEFIAKPVDARSFRQK